ncbi:MAG TPA: hypothetical protein VL485_15435 [Ktedonobacteraceae bacterium]|nr:hypothetical protein [Ktedonobacteraceae bacterium]
MQQDINRLTIEVENQNMQERMNDQAGVELSDADLAQISGARGNWGGHRGGNWGGHWGGNWGGRWGSWGWGWNGHRGGHC